jgi:hypothetical protein
VPQLTVPIAQAPAPSQSSVVTVPLAQLWAPQTVPIAYFWQAPLPDAH